MELFIDLGLKEIASIIGRMGLTTNIDQMKVDNLELNGVNYEYSKNGNEITIKDSLGNVTKVRINYNEKEGKDAYNRDIKIVNHEVAIDYVLKDGTMIKLENNIPLYSGYESFENVHRHDLLRGLRTKFCDNEGKEIASFNLELDEICLKSNNVKYIFDKDGIKYNNVVLSLDGNSLVSIGGNPIPSKDLIQSFNLEDEREKVNRIIRENKDLHPFTLEELEDTTRKLDRRDRFVKKVNEFYEKDIQDIRKVIEVRNHLLDSVENNLVDIDGLDLIARDYYFKTRENTKSLR